MEEKNIFMVCERLDREALRELPEGYHFRLCRKEELGLWKRMPFDTPEMAKEYEPVMSGYFESWYAPKRDLFFKTCLFVCDQEDRPVGTGFVWKQHDLYTTLHWIKILKPYEDRGLGRALLSKLMADIPSEDYPVYLHTQPSSYRAIKLYTDFGFSFISHPDWIDDRPNESLAALEELKETMPEEAFARLRTVDCSQWKAKER